MPAGRGVVMAKPSLATALTLPQAILAQTPVGYWKLDETSGTTAIDYSGNGRDGTYSGAVTLADTLGPDGIMYPTWAAGGRVTIPHNVAWSQTGIGLTLFTVSKPTTVANGRFLMEKGMDGVKEWIWNTRFSVSGGGIELQLATMRPTSGGSAVKTSYTTNGGHVPAVWNVNASTMFGTTSAGVFQHFRGSSVPAQKTDTVITGSVTNAAGLLYIGDDPSTSPTNTFIGQICHVAVFQGVLTRAQIKVIMDAARNDGWLDATYDDQEVVQPVAYEIDTVVQAPVADIIVGTDSDVSQAITYELDTITQTTVSDILTPEDGSAVQPVTYNIKTVAATPTVATDTLSGAITPLSPAGYWKLNEASGLPQDTSGNARHIITNSATLRGVLGPTVGAYITRTNTSEIVANDNNAWTPTASGMTVFFIARPTSLIDGRHFMAKCGGGSTNEWRITQTAAGIITAELLSAAGTVLRSTSSPVSTVVTDTWQAYCVTFSGNTDAATITLYKNGNTAIAGSTTASAGSGTVTNGIALLGLGYSQLLTTAGMTGGLAHCAIWTSVLSGANIGTIMSAADADGWF